MANRQYKKVLGAPTLPPQQSDDSDDDFQPAIARNKKHTNPFGVLQDSEAEQASDDPAEGSGSAAERLEHAEPVKEEKKKKKRKRKKKNRKDSDGEVEPAESLDEVEQCVRAVNRLLGAPAAGVAAAAGVAGPAPAERVRPGHLDIDRRYLDVRYEVRKKFGVDSLKEFYPVPKGERHWSKKTNLIIYRKETWPKCKNLDLSMCIVGEGAEGVRRFAFSHGPDYKQVQRSYCLAMDSGAVDVVREILYEIPYHLDSLLMLVITSRRMEAHKESDELLDKLLFALEQALHPSFSLHSGKCRLEYQYQVNRIFHIAILKYIKVVQSQACHRTALELIKMLLGLDPSDPLALMLLVDSAALVAGEHRWLVDAIAQWDSEFKVLMLPNMAYSYALATFQIAVEAGEDTSVADELLERALLIYPKQLLMLLDKCSSRRKREFESEALYTTLTDYTTSQPLMHMLRLYAARAAGAWAERGALAWLERGAERTLARFKGELGYVDAFGYHRRAVYQSTPLSVLRHLNILDVDDVPLLSSDSPGTRTKERITDPYPPEDGVTEYAYLLIKSISGRYEVRVDRLVDMVRAADSYGEEILSWSQAANGVGLLVISIVIISITTVYYTNV